MLTRLFTANDVEAVAGLLQQADPAAARAAKRSLCDSLRTTYLQSPLCDGESPSRVFEGAHGISGFFGAIRLPMRFRGRRIDAVVGGTLAIHPALRLHPFIHSRLLRDFADGPHELVITKSSNAAVRTFWQLNGAAALPQFSRRWLQVLRPAQFAAGIAAKARARLPRDAAERALSQLSLRAGLRSPFAYTRSVSSLRAAELTASRLGEAVDEVVASSALRIDGDSRSLDWLMEGAESTSSGRMIRTALYDRSRIAGWYQYDARPGDTAQVLQVMAAPGAEETVLEHLFADAWRRGSVAIAGAVLPSLMPALAEQSCLFAPGRTQVQVSSRNRDLLHALHRGDALLTPLEWSVCDRDVRGVFSRPQSLWHSAAA